MEVEQWAPGEHVVVRSMWNGRIVAAWPMIVVMDSAEALVLYLPAGTVYKLRTFPADSSSRLPLGDWSFVDQVWRAGLLRVMFPGDRHAYLAFWEGHRFDHWYVNLETPYRRSRSGIDFVDHFLDIVIQPDLTTWKWKDEQELADAVAAGLVAQNDADAIRGEGERALLRLKTKAPPFGDGWENWKPDPGWPIPQLPSDWQSRL